MVMRLYPVMDPKHTMNMDECLFYAHPVAVYDKTL